ncbi:hypothetical protein LTR53_016524, partial [Teratosphaeriaceae sp. CCFEE 6253]
MNSAMTDSTDSILSKLNVSPQTIPEGTQVEHSLDGLTSPTTDLTNPLSRKSSTLSMRAAGARRIPNAERERRSSRRSASATTSLSPAQAFLASWNREGMTAEPAPECPDDEGKSFGAADVTYVIGRTLAHGGFGTIKEAHTLTAGGQKLVRAVKIVRKAAAGAGGDVDKVQQDLEHEISVWRHLEHPHILRMHAAYDSGFATFCVMDLNEGGTLFDLVRQCRANAAELGGRRAVEPGLARGYAFQLACALRYLHQDVRVCHRDVKLENCLLDMRGPGAETHGGVLRLCDFGLADFLHGDSSTADDATSPDDRADAAAPEPASSSSEPGDTRRPTSSIIGTLEYASPKGLS